MVSTETASPVGKALVDELPEPVGKYPDGIKVDVDGNIYVGCSDGVRVFTAGGESLGLLRLASGGLVLSGGRLNGSNHDNYVWFDAAEDGAHGRRRELPVPRALVPALRHAGSACCRARGDGGARASQSPKRRGVVSSQLRL